MNFDKYQQEVIHEKENLLVIAGPGSGKTTTILAKVEYLLNFCDESEILMISFTNKSVEDIQKRLKNNIMVTTFHKLAIDILKYNNIKYSLCSDKLLEYITSEYLLSLDKENSKKLIDYLGLKSLNIKSKEFISLKRLIISFINLFKTNNFDINKLIEIVKNYEDKFLIGIILTIFYMYENEKQSTASFDFDDLIINATNLLEKNYNYKKFKYIIIDEFQDTSLIRLNLIKTLYDNNDCHITVVGDDAQSIFHFTGCNLNIFLNFQNYFPNTKMLFLKNTYRYNQKLINITENFICKNSIQIKKNMIGKSNSTSPLEIIYYYNPILEFKIFLDHFKDNKNLLILLRNKCDLNIYIDKNFKVYDDYFIYKERIYKYMTIHSSKGLESKYVLILNVNNTLLGIPNKIENHKILSYLETNDETSPYAEERRVFFVALTRCKEKVYLMTSKNNPSVFIKEIKKWL